MNELAKIISIGIVGLFAGIFIGKKNKSKGDNNDDFFVYLDTEDFGKQSLDVYSYGEAKSLFDEYSKKGKIKYSDVLNYSSQEKELNKKLDEKDRIKADTYSKIEYISFGQGNTDYETKELK